jgi:hypothetical protein
MMNDVKALCDAPNVPGLINFYGAYHVPDSGQVSAQGHAATTAGAGAMAPLQGRLGSSETAAHLLQLSHCPFPVLMPLISPPPDIHCPGVHGWRVPGGCAGQGRAHPGECPQPHHSARAAGADVPAPEAPGVWHQNGKGLCVCPCAMGLWCSSVQRTHF